MSMVSMTYDRRVNWSARFIFLFTCAMSKKSLERPFSFESSSVTILHPEGKDQVWDYDVLVHCFYSQTQNYPLFNENTNNSLKNSKEFA